MLKITTRLIHDVGMDLATVDMEKITGLNFRGFKPTEVFVDILSRFLNQNSYYLRVTLTFMEKLYGALENCKNYESLAQRIFPRLHYIM